MVSSNGGSTFGAAQSNGGIAVVTVLFCVSALSASAQSQNDPRSTARMRLGPFYVTPTIVVKNLGIDTNVFNTVDDPKSDFTATAGPNVEVFVPIWLAGVSVESVTDFVYFHSFESERSVNTDLRVRGEVPLRRMTLFAENSYLNTKERTSFEIDLRSRRVQNQFEVGVDVALARKLNLSVSGRQSAFEYDADAFFEGSNLAEVLNRHARTAAVSLRYRLTPLTMIVLTGEATETRFRLSPKRDSDSVSVVPGVEFNPRGLISGSGHVGFRHFAGIGSFLPDFTGLVASVDLSYRLLGSMSVGFTADRGVEYSFEPTEPYYVATSYGGSVRQQVIGRFEVGVGVRQYNYQYRESVADTGQARTGGRTDTIRNYSLSLGYRLNLESSFDVNVSYWQRRSDQRDFRHFEGIRIGTSVGYGF